MRIMLDTNILLSALIFGSSKLASLLEKVLAEHTLVLSPYIIDEFRSVITRKSPKHNHAVDMLFDKLPYETACAPIWQEFMPDIRDEKDKPVLAAAILADVDIIITGDKDFYGIDIERPEILSPADFWKRYGS
jgi:putative PIN family toxin of toxin-antitoxin system